MLDSLNPEQLTAVTTMDRPVLVLSTAGTGKTHVLTAKAVYACGPMGMLRAVTEIATAHGARAEVAVEEAMACGIGVCMTCVLPVVGADGVTRMSRSCVDGPIFDATTVRWDAVAGGRVAVPADCLGAPR